MAATAPLLRESERFAYLKPKDVARLEEAYRFSEAAHAGQTRQSGDPYISHPLAVAEILAGWHLDGQTLMAALLHDVTEDTSVTKDEISDTFGKPVAELVDGVSKLDKIEFTSAEHLQAENFRKMLLAMARDVRVILIKLADGGVQATVHGREKHVYSTYRKMIEKHLSFSEVHDIFGIRVIVADIPTCYLAMGALHALYKPIPGKFKDYIAIPKANGYQSIHTDLIGPYGVPVEVQVRTEQMHRLAESGVASHWLYKDETDQLSDLQKQTHRWLQSLLEIQNQSGDPREFLEHVKGDRFPDEWYVFTPKGKILSLPRGATTVDFAYAVHTDIGNRCVAAKVNGELVPLRQELRNGDRVEVITASHAKPNPGWLQYVRTGKARSNIRHFLKTMQYEESASLGERLLDQALRPGKKAKLRSRSAAPKAWRCSSRAAAGRSRATRSSARSRRARASSCTSPNARASCARARTSPISGSMSSGIRAPAAFSRPRCTSWWRTSAACSRASPRRLPKPPPTSTRSPPRTTVASSPPCTWCSRS